VAEKGETKFMAEDPVTLLGVQAIYESRQSDWKATDDELDNFLKEFPCFQFR
jgi:hypothetical protein